MTGWVPRRLVPRRLRRQLGRRLTLVVTGLLLTVPLACGGGGDDNNGGAAPGTPEPGNASDDEIARAANLRLTDFPPGWQRSPAAVRRPDSPEDVRFTECMGRPPSRENRTALADSDNFSTGRFTRANSSVQVVRTEDIAREDLAALRTDRALPCLRERVEAQLAAQQPSGAPPFQQQSLNRLDVANVADETVAFRVTVSAPSVEPGATLTIDQIFVRKGRVELNTSFIELDGAFSTDLAQTLVQKMAARA
jgi:hypothetical protein